MAVLRIGKVDVPVALFTFRSATGLLCPGSSPTGATASALAHPRVPETTRLVLRICVAGSRANSIDKIAARVGANTRSACPLSARLADAQHPALSVRNGSPAVRCLFR